MTLIPDQVVDSLVGADFAEVRRRFGAPLACRLVGGELHFAYRLLDGRRCEDAVVVTDGVTTRVHPLLSPVGQSPESWVGCSVDDVLARLGNPDSALPRRDAVELRFADAVLLVADGLVIAASKPLTRAG